MIHLYFAVIISILILIPHTINAFFLEDLANITVTRNITCQLNDNETLIDDFQYCAIRIYIGWNGTQDVLFTIYNGLWYVNTFHRYIQTNCNGFVPTSDGKIDTGTGSGYCDQPLPFETFSKLKLCICATDNCNQDMNSCVDSTLSNTNISSILDFMPDLTSTIQCDDTLNASNTCQEHPFINVSACEDYVQNNSVLCAITINKNETIQTPLIYINYEAFLSEKIHEAKTAANNTIEETSFSETDTNVYFKYFDNNIGYVKECVCTSYSLCNQNIDTCLVQAAIEITTSILSFTEISSAIFASETSLSISTFFTSAIISTTPTTSAISSTTTMSTNSTITTAQTSTVISSSIQQSILLYLFR